MRNNHSLNNALKIVIISALVSLNVEVWYEVFGYKLGIFIVLLVLAVVFHKENER